MDLRFVRFAKTDEKCELFVTEIYTDFFLTDKGLSLTERSELEKHWQKRRMGGLVGSISASGQSTEPVAMRPYVLRACNKPSLPPTVFIKGRAVLRIVTTVNNRLSSPGDGGRSVPVQPPYNLRDERILPNISLYATALSRGNFLPVGRVSIVGKSLNDE